MMLNDEQLTVLWVGTLAAVGVGLYPPWVADGRFIGWRRLWDKSTGRIDVVRLVIQWAIVAALTFGAVVSVRRPRHDVFRVPAETGVSSQTNKLDALAEQAKEQKRQAEVERAWERLQESGRKGR